MVRPKIHLETEAWVGKFCRLNWQKHFSNSSRSLGQNPLHTKAFLVDPIFWVNSWLVDKPRFIPSVSTKRFSTKRRGTLKFLHVELSKWCSAHPQCGSSSCSRRQISKWLPTIWRQCYKTIFFSVTDAADNKLECLSLADLGGIV
jgi:hypothetical protein